MRGTVTLRLPVLVVVPKLAPLWLNDWNFWFSIHDVCQRVQKHKIEPSNLLGVAVEREKAKGGIGDAPNEGSLWEGTSHQPISLSSFPF